MPEAVPAGGTAMLVAVASVAASSQYSRVYLPSVGPKVENQTRCGPRESRGTS